jgi:arylsulfatase A-like enzyme
MNTFGVFGPNNKVTGTSLDETLLSNLFKEGGYKTKAIGKWHLSNIRMPLAALYTSVLSVDMSST